MTGEEQPDPRVGLCSACAHARRVPTGKGSVFWLCEVAATDRRFRKYPQLPVLRCGFVVRDSVES